MRQKRVCALMLAAVVAAGVLQDAEIKKRMHLQELRQMTGQRQEGRQALPEMWWN